MSLHPQLGSAAAHASVWATVPELEGAVSAPTHSPSTYFLHVCTSPNRITMAVVEQRWSCVQYA
jgi:hypothetical protein